VNTRLASLLILVAALGRPVEASCLFTPGRVVRATVLRCESAAPYLQAADRASPYTPPRMEGGRLVTGPPVDLAKLSEEKSPGTILVLNVTSELGLEPALSPRGINGVHAERAWRSVVEHARVWWQGTAEACNQLPSPPSTVELYLHAGCCDLEPPLGACLAGIDLGSPVPEDIQAIIRDVPAPKLGR
jgi:hypothetical protein